MTGDLPPEQAPRPKSKRRWLMRLIGFFVLLLLLLGVAAAFLGYIIYDHVTRPGIGTEKIFRNCEVYTVRDGKLVATDVYFGWNVPHEVRPGEHKSPAT